jgi:hypothetical protein
MGMAERDDWDKFKAVKPLVKEESGYERPLPIPRYGFIMSHDKYFANLNKTLAFENIM